VRYVHGQITHPIGCEALHDFRFPGFAQGLVLRPVSAPVVRGGFSPAAIAANAELYRFACLEKPCATSDGLVDGGKDFLFLGFGNLQPPKISEVFFAKREVRPLRPTPFPCGSARPAFCSFLFVEFCGDHVAVAGVLHCGKRELSSGLELAERDAVLFAELDKFIDAQALRLCDKAELCKRRSFHLSLFHGDSSAMVPTDGHPGFFMRSRKASLMLLSTFDFLILSLFRPVFEG
jgi:hypothetical protein